MRRKTLLFLILAALSLAVLISVTACKRSPEVLPAPQEWTMEKRFLIWSPVENATGYLVRIDNKEYQTTDSRLELLFLTLTADYHIDIMALGDGKAYADSTWTRLTVHLEAPTEHGFDELGFEYTLLEDYSGYEVSRGTADLHGVITIPDYYGDYPVTQIASSGFKLIPMGELPSEVGGNVITTGIQFPSRLESIGAFAFYGSFTIEELVFPDTVTSIGNNAFAYCYGLKRLVLSKKLKVISDSAFIDTPLAEIVWPEALEYIGESAFATEYFYVGAPGDRSRCGHIDSKLASVVLPDTVTYIGARAFEGRNSLATIVLPEGLEHLGGCAFYETLWHDQRVRGDQEPDFYMIGDILVCIHSDLVLPEIYTIPSHIKKIAGGAYSRMLKDFNLKKVIIPDGVLLIGGSIFSFAAELAEVILPSDLKSIPEECFMHTAIQSITLPDTLTYIGRLAFSSTPISEITLPDSVEYIGEQAFSHTNLTHVILPKGLKRIGPSVFSDCTKLQSVLIPASLEVMEDYPFYGCTSPDVKIYYEGTEEQYLAIVKDLISRLQVEEEKGINLSVPSKLRAIRAHLETGSFYYYSESAPTAPGRYWHYVDGVPTPWGE